MELSSLGAFVSNSIFPANYIIDLPNLNIEMMQYNAKQWNLEHTKMGKGLFEGNISAVHTPRIQLSSSYFSQSFMTQGDFPDGCSVLIYAINDARYNFQNRVVQANEIIVLSKGDEIDVLASGEMDVGTIVIEEQLFYQTFYDYFDDTPHRVIKDKRFSIKPDMISVFHQTVDLWKTYLTKEYPTLNEKPPYEKMEPEILRQLFNCIISTPFVKKIKKFQTKTVRDLLHGNIDKLIDISDITTKLSISESQLHHAFKKDYGITPKKYLQSLRFNAIKKELLYAHPHTHTVSQIAQKYQLFHIGHFSTEYQKRFGQTPAQTLNSKL
jgi:AraC family transcriptional regulator, ethanolamine operon transcriptional activator